MDFVEFLILHEASVEDELSDRRVSSPKAQSPRQLPLSNRQAPKVRDKNTPVDSHRTNSEA
jgi:hypothetical protein